MFAEITAAFQIARIVVALEGISGAGVALLVVYFGARWLIKSFKGC